MNGRITLVGSVLVALVAVVAGALTGCESKKGTLVPNMLPGVELTATPPAGDTTRYDIEFQWTGWDYDGEVDHFEYYIDPPLEVIQNPLGFEDTLTWRRTDAYSGRFTFFAPDYDTTTIDEPDKDYKEPQVALGYHIFVIRAVDDMGAKSVVNDSSWVAFTAGTICPRTKIITPPPQYAEAADGRQPLPQSVGTTVTFRWEGTDSDGIFSDKPIFYMMKRVDVTDRQRLWDQIDDYVLEDPAPWDTLDPGVTQVTLSLDNGHSYGIAVRAVDEARAVEPLLVLNRNLMWVGATQATSYPVLEVRSSAFGNKSWTGWSIDFEDYEVPMGSLFEFSLYGNADVYGGLIAGYSYGWNLPDVENTETNPTGDGAWTPWSTSQTKIIADFSEDRVTDPETGEVRDQFLYVRCKDDGGRVTLASLRFNVVTLEPVYKIGYVDDWELERTREAYEDLSWQQMLNGYNYGADWEELEWDVAERRIDRVPTLQFLSQFECIVYSVRDAQAVFESAYFDMNHIDVMNVLAVYLASQTSTGERGKLWLFGHSVVHSSVQGSSTVPNCTYDYEVNEDSAPGACAIVPGCFLYDLLHIRGDFRQPGGTVIDLSRKGGENQSLDYLYFEIDGGPAIGDTSYVYDPKVHPEQYARLPAKLEKRASYEDPIGQAYKANTFEALLSPDPREETQLIFFEPAFGDMPGKLTGVVPLYKLKYRPDSQGHFPKGNNRYCAFRYIPKMGEQGEVVYFLVPMYNWKPTQARQVAKAVLTDMFGFPDPDLP